MIAMGKAAKIRGMPDAHKKHLKMLPQFLLWRLAKKPAHGYVVMSDLKEFKLASFQQSTVYAVLAELERKGQIRSRIMSDGARIRKVFYTTPKGKAVFEKTRKTRITGIIRDFLRALSA